MGIVIAVFSILSWLLALAWLLQAILVIRGMPRVADLNRIDRTQLPDLTPSLAPHLTVIVPACNEETHIRAALTSLLSSIGLRLQIIAVDDRSTDRTGAIMDAVAADAHSTASPHTLTVLHNRELPKGWLGKPHALHLAAQHATAPWLLFTDGDVTFAPNALALALRYAMRAKVDHLVLLPTLAGSGVFEKAMLALVQAGAQWIVKPWKVPDPKTRDFIGVGGFNLIRTSTYEKLGGFLPLRMEIVEDMALGWRVKRGGYRSEAITGVDLVRIPWLNGPFGIARAIEKNAFAAVRYRIGYCLVGCAGLFLDAIVPLAAIVLGGWPLVAGLLTYIAIALIYHANRRMNGVGAAHVLLLAPSAVILSYAFARSMMITLKNNGVSWRGTHYSLPELRANMAKLN